jgi:hypothetical protein
MNNCRYFNLLIILILGLATPGFSQNLTFERQAEGWLLKEKGLPRFFYQVQTKDKDGKYPRSNYIHPLYGINGDVLTEDFPDDHLHHRGIFWTWHQLWVGEERIADPWVCEGIEWIIEEVMTDVVSNEKAVLNAKVLWRETGSNSRDIIEESVILTYERLADDLYRLSFDITLQPLLENVKIGGSEDPKGYGGFSPRIKLTENVGFFDKKGKVYPQNLAIQAGPWINVTHENENDPGVVIMGEPDQLPSYQGWILRAKNSMQNMAFPGQEPLTLDEAGLKFRHQLLVHAGIEPEKVNQLYKAFTDAPSN